MCCADCSRDDGEVTGFSYVALGDSISIDEYAGGPGRGGASLLARNRDDDFPDWRGRDLQTREQDLRWHLLAVDGGTIRTVLDDQLPRLERLGVTPDLATLTVGGNDVLGCYGDTRSALATVSAVRAGVSEILGRIGAISAGATVIVGTVYDPSDGTADASRVGLPPWPEVVDVLAELNRALRVVAAEHGARVADIHATFLGHGLGVGDPAQSDPRPRNRHLWYCDIIEPNAWGASGVREAFWKALYPSEEPLATLPGPDVDPRG